MKRLFLIICLLLVPSVVMAASSRILPASYTEYTYDSAGGGEDYTALATWEADTDIDVSSTGQVLTCSSGIHNDAVILDGATTDSNGFRVIRAAEGARGTPTSGVRFVTASNGDAEIDFYTFICNENYFVFQDLAVKRTNTYYNSRGCAWYLRPDSGEKIYCIGCTAYECGDTNGSNAFGYGFGAASVSSAGGESYFINCLAKDIVGNLATATCGFLVNVPSVYYNTTAYLYNCTSINSQKYGLIIRADTDKTTTVYSKNCIFQDNTSGSIYTFGGGTYAHTQTTNATSGVTFAADGYHLASNDTGAIGNGTDLSADGVFAFTDDIDGETRDDWDIGADEYVASSTRRRVIIVGD